MNTYPGIDGGRAAAAEDLTLDGLAAQAGTLRVFHQVFAVLAREHGAMIDDPDLLDVDEAVLGAFAEAGTEGLTVDQVTARCAAHDPHLVARRFEVLRGYGALTRVIERPHERYHRAAFAPYVMLLFLRRMAAQGGQGELHQLLTVEDVGVRGPQAGPTDGHGAVHRLTTVFRLMANQLSGLAAASPVEELRENADLLWGNRALIAQAEQVHATVLRRWPTLGPACAGLRTALAAYADATDAAAARLIEQAGSTRALGLLPAETWRTFARTADVDRLATVLSGVLFDAPAPWFSPQQLVQALDSAELAAPARPAPPRSVDDGPVGERSVLDDGPTPEDDLGAAVELLSGGEEAILVSEVLDQAPDWAAARRLLARLTAAHQHPELGWELSWSDGLRLDPTAGVAWVSDGTLRRIPDAEREDSR